MYTLITDIDYLYLCRECVFRRYAVVNVFENVLKVYVNVTCTIQKKRDTGVNCAQSVIIPMLFLK